MRLQHQGFWLALHALGALALCGSPGCNNMAGRGGQEKLLTEVAAPRALYVAPQTIDQARADRPRRENNILYSSLYWFLKRAEPALPEIPPWPDPTGHGGKASAVRAIGTMGTILEILADPTRFQDGNGQYTDHPEVGAFVTSQGSEIDTFHFWQNKIETYLQKREFQPLGNVGNNAPDPRDYDMVLARLLGLLYGLKDRTHYLTGEHVLTNTMIQAILCQHSDECQDKNRPFHSFTTNPWDLVLAEPVDLVYQPETENHVLMLATWDWLVSTWVMWQGRIVNTSDPRYSTAMTAMRQDNFATWMQIRDDLQDLLLRVLARVVQRGFFETNAKPYQNYAALPIFLLANYSNLVVDPDVPEFTTKVQQAAQNAWRYLVTKYAFQSLRQKRVAPMRRNYHYRNSLSPYSGTAMPKIMGLLTGVYDFDDCTGIYDPANPQLDVDQCLYNWRRGPADLVLPVLLSRYELPEILHGLFVEKPAFFARMQAKYYRGDYELADLLFHNLTSGSSYPGPAGGEFEGVPELYFGTDQLLLSAGGMHKRYYDANAGELKQYHLWAKPITLLFRGDYGHDWDSPGDDHVADLKRVAQDALLFRGRHWSWPKSKCNLWVYKNFAYGYDYHDKWWCSVPSWHTGWPQDYPSFWDDFIDEEFDIDGSAFRVFYFPADTVGVPSDDYYIVMSKLRRDSAKWATNRELYEYRRGFVEVLPGWMFSSSAELANVIRQNNPAEHFRRNNRSAPFYYVLSSTGERLKLHPFIGIDIQNERDGCLGGIQEIAAPDGAGGFVPLSSDQLADAYLPMNAASLPDTRQTIPLITVWELDSTWNQTGIKLVETLETGRIAVRRRAMVCTGWNYTTFPPTCMTWGAGWQCLRIDSRDYQTPTSDYGETVSYQDCAPQ